MSDILNTFATAKPNRECNLHDGREIFGEVAELVDALL